MPQPKIPTPPNAGTRAREQAEAYDSIFAPVPLELDNGDTVLVPPHPNLRMLDDDRMEAYEELLFEVEGYDRHPDVFYPEQHLTDGAVIPSDTRRGELKWPHRLDGVLVKPPFSIREVVAVLGESEYKRLRAGGKCAADVRKIWTEQNLKLAERQSWDSKSYGSAGNLESVSGGDSG